MDKSAFEENVLGCESTLYHVAKSILSKDSDCEDAVQEALFKAFKKLKTLKNDEYFKTWLIRILINECYQLLREKKDTVNFEEALCFDSSFDSYLSFEVYSALMKLTPKLRTTMVLFYIDGYSIKEIKRITNVPEGTVKSRLSKGRKQMKLNLEVDYERV